MKPPTNHDLDDFWRPQPAGAGTKPARPQPNPEPFETTPLGNVAGHGQTDLVELARQQKED